MTKKRNPFEQFSAIEEKVLERVNLNKAYERAKNQLNSELINPDNFTNLYKEEEILRDKNYVATREAQFKECATPESEEIKKRAEILEAIIHEQVEMAEWLGPEVLTIKSSRYDDIANGIDTIAEFSEESEKEKISYLGLAIDVTFSTAEAERKLNAIKEKIQKGQLGRIKYFYSPRSGKKELSMMPCVVVGLGQKNFEELVELWMQNDKKTLAGHPAQIQILEEIRLQLDSFKNYAQKIKQKKIAEILEKNLLKIEEIINEKIEREETILPEDLYHDPVFSAISDIMEKIN